MNAQEIFEAIDDFIDTQDVDFYIAKRRQLAIHIWCAQPLAVRETTSSVITS